ncbi:MAG: hypothetical protein JWN39_284 [Ilumatobacteraceae bacterium]|nr:hypothetical protein [Ilumatobacteraceae bacterium]
MTVKRLLAFLGAVALIVGAVFARNALDDKSSDSTSSTGQSTGGNLTVVCSTEFADVCAKLPPSDRVTVEPASQTLADLVKDGAQPPDAWVTLDPFPGMVDIQRQVATLDPLDPTIVAVATDVAEIAVAKTRADAFALACNGQPAWKCIGTNAGAQWTTLDPAAAGGKLLPGFADPDSEALGLITFANAVAGYLNNPDFSTSDWSDNAELNGWLRNLKNADVISANGASALDTLLVRATSVNVAATTGVELQASPSPDAVVASPTSPAVPIVAVVGAFTSKGAAVAEQLSPLLTKAGWTRATDPEPQLPAGTFIALRKLWEGK